MSAQLLGGDDVLIAAVARQWRGKHPLANSARVVTSRNRRLLPDAEDEKGWPDSAYAVSKIAAFAFTLIVGREEYFAKSRVLVNAVCPGYVACALLGTSPSTHTVRWRCGGEGRGFTDALAILARCKTTACDACVVSAAGAAPRR